MIFDLKQKKNKFLEDSYKKSMEELNNFYGINWVRNIPKIFIVNNKKDKIALRGKQAHDWVVGWVNGGNIIFLMDRLKIKTDTSHKKGYSKKQYKALIKHELDHLFFKILTEGSVVRIVWLSEGLAIYTSGQNKFKKCPEKFSQFLSFYDKHQEEYKNKKVSVYYESGFFVEMLVDKFGKEKLLRFLKSLQKIKNRKEFDNLFFKIYKFKLNYKEINKIYTK